MTSVMKSENEFNTEILRITMTIQEKYPELSEYLGEMPVTVPSVIKPEINSMSLGSYYDSLNSLLESYIPGHSPKETK